MRKFFTILALITALTVGADAHSVLYTVQGQDSTDKDTFSVHFAVQLTPIQQESESIETQPGVSEDVTSYETYTPEEDESVEGSYVEETVVEDSSVDSTVYADTTEETVNDTTEETQKDVFGGEGTIVFSPDELKILSVTPLFPEGVGYDIYTGDGSFCRFMYYSSAVLTENFPLFDIEFEILSVGEDGYVSVNVTEGLFSNGMEDSPAEDFTYKIKVNNFTPVTTKPPVTTQSDTTVPTHTETDAETTSAVQTETDKDVTYAETVPPPTQSYEEPKDDDSNTALIVTGIIIFSVAVLAAAVILITKKIKNR